MQFRKKQTAGNVIGGGFFLVAFYFLIRSVILSFSIDIWYDELFTMEFVKRPIGEMLPLAARDVHPPLYYMIVRFFVTALGSLGLVGDSAGRIPIEVVAKLASVLPFVILMIYSITVIRKRFGMLAAGLFSFAIVSMPQLPEYTTEIRMYSYAVLFVTGMLIHGYLLLLSFWEGNARGWDIGNGLALWLYAGAAAYTHYYAALSAGILFGMLFLIMLVGYLKAMKAKEHANLSLKAFGMLIICINLTAVSYVPWLSVFLSQASAVKANYWIQPVGLRSFGSAVKYLFKGYFSSDAAAAILAVFLFVLTAVLFVRTLVRAVRERKPADMFALMSFVVLPILVTAGIILSVVIRPVFVNRYMLPAYGCFWLAVSVMLSAELEGFITLVTSLRKKQGADPANTDSKRAGAFKWLYGVMGAVMAVLLAVVGFVDFRTFIGNENYRKINMEKTLSLFEDISSDTIIISNFTHVQGLLGYYLNRDGGDYRICLYQEQPEPLICEMVPGLETMDDPIDICNYLDGGKKVLFLGSFNSRDVLVKEWEDNLGIKNENQGSYLMERYWFDVFALRNY